MCSYLHFDSGVYSDSRNLQWDITVVRQNLKLELHVKEFTRSVNKVMRLPAYRTIWQYCGLAFHMKVR